jgi:hypothetical protein
MFVENRRDIRPDYGARYATANVARALACGNQQRGTAAGAQQVVTNARRVPPATSPKAQRYTRKEWQARSQIAARTDAAVDA